MTIHEFGKVNADCAVLDGGMTPYRFWKPAVFSCCYAASKPILTSVPKYNILYLKRGMV